ncbi:hypothetical protein BX264_1848 [Streptomyces sp. 2333.5]|nr:hypothetical protein BX264_1848 [Streptomyces sp. 2333.5]SEC67720.1 hypothetical protein SAMN05428943_1992 [Streptomyces sp. 2314.4]SED46024.1 hypothetical protein SAMN05428942_1864 [Streptomyces sp. 2112.2]
MSDPSMPLKSYIQGEASGWEWGTVCRQVYRRCTEHLRERALIQVRSNSMLHFDI